VTPLDGISAEGMLIHKQSVNKYTPTVTTVDSAYLIMYTYLS